jgi:hypothetical protein
MATRSEAATDDVLAKAEHTVRLLLKADDHRRKRLTYREAWGETTPFAKVRVLINCQP